jgi:hypothetical protein
LTPSKEKEVPRTEAVETGLADREVLLGHCIGLVHLGVDLADREVEVGLGGPS